MHSQVLGIVWLSVGLMLVAGVAFFSSRKVPEAPSEDSLAASGHEILARHEAEAYRSRRNQPEAKANTPPDRPSSPTPAPKSAPPRPTRQPLVVELNAADSLTLQLLHGIGPAYARRMVRYRERLGGFVSTGQLLEVYGFTPELLASIEPCLRIDTAAIRRIDINEVELKQLIRHPYIEYYQARDLVRLRLQGVRFRSADDLRAVPSMADSTLDRLLPYLDFGEEN